MVRSRSTCECFVIRLFGVHCVRCSTLIELIIDCRVARCLCSCFWAHCVCERAFLLGKPSAHRWRFAGSGKIETSEPNSATALLLLPVSYWFYMSGIFVLLSTALLLSTAKTTFGTSSRAGMNMLSL